MQNKKWHDTNSCTLVGLSYVNIFLKEYSRYHEKPHTPTLSIEGILFFKCVLDFVQLQFGLSSSDSIAFAFCSNQPQKFLRGYMYALSGMNQITLLCLNTDFVFKLDLRFLTVAYAVNRDTRPEVIDHLCNILTQRYVRLGRCLPKIDQSLLKLSTIKIPFRGTNHLVLKSQRGTQNWHQQDSSATDNALFNCFRRTLEKTGRIVIDAILSNYIQIDSQIVCCDPDQSIPAEPSEDGYESDGTKDLKTHIFRAKKIRIITKNLLHYGLVKSAEWMRAAYAVLSHPENAHGLRKDHLLLQHPTTNHLTFFFKHAVTDSKPEELLIFRKLAK